MRKMDVTAKLKALHKIVKTKLSDPRAYFYDPKYHLEVFKRFEPLRDKLKSDYPDLFTELSIREIPKPSSTTDFEGRGYILRADILQLLEDIEYCLDILTYKMANEVSSKKSNMDEYKTVKGREKHKTKHIFISHAEADQPIVQALIDELFVGCLNFKIADILCTSIPGAKIKSGEDWRDYLYDNLLGAKVIFLIITPNYRASEICLNEMGAAWATNAHVIPMKISSLGYDKVGVLPVVKQIEELDDEQSIDRIKDILQEVFQIPSTDIKSDRWSDKKKKYLSKIDDYLKMNPFSPPPTTEYVEELLGKYVKMDKENRELHEKMEKLQEIVMETAKLKDKKEVDEIKKKYASPSTFDEFEQLLSQVREAFDGIDSIITTIIFNGYTGRDLEVDVRHNTRSIREAIARGYINKDLEVDWNSTTKMQRIYETLKNLESFYEGIDRGSIEDFNEHYEDAYEFPFDIKNLDFWEKVLLLDLDY